MRQKQPSERASRPKTRKEELDTQETSTLAGTDASPHVKREGLLKRRMVQKGKGGDRKGGNHGKTEKRSMNVRCDTVKAATHAHKR